MDDWEQARQRRADRRRNLRNPGAGGCPAFIGEVTSTGSAIGTGKFLNVRAVYVIGAETEGGSPTKATLGEDIPCCFIGSTTLTTGDQVVCRFVNYRWVAEMRGNGAGGLGYGTIPSCFCSPIPATLTMTAPDEDCDYGGFQSCTIQYGPPPEGLALLNLGPNIFMSTEDFPDPVAGGVRFFYQLTCQFNAFSLYRLYLTSPYVPPGYPDRSGPYFTWFIGGDGNTCRPFALLNGLYFSGSTCTSGSVTITP